MRFAAKVVLVAAMKIAPILVSNLLKMARAYAEHEGIKLATVGRYIHGSSDIFEQLEAGDASVSLKKYDAMMAELDKRWPEGLRRPKLREFV